MARRKQSPFFLALLAILLPLLFAAGLLRFHQTDFVQLKKLEATARSIRYTNSGYHPAKGNRLYWGVQNLEFKAHMLNAHVVYGQPEEGTVGTSTFGPVLSPRIIVISDAYQWNARFDTLAHELAHYLSPQSTMEDGAREVFCDAVSFLTARRMGFDTLDTNAYHLAMYKDSLHAIDDYASEIAWAADFLSR